MDEHGLHEDVPASVRRSRLESDRAVAGRAWRSAVELAAAAQAGQERAAALRRGFESRRRRSGAGGTR
jgi:hypothetical protein